MTDTPTFLTQRKLCQRYDVTRQTIYEWRKDPRVGFPQPVKISDRNRWRVDDIEQWERQRVVKRNG